MVLVLLEMVDELKRQRKKFAVDVSDILVLTFLTVEPNVPTKLKKAELIVDLVRIILNQLTINK